MKVLFVNDEYMAQGGVEQYILSSAALLNKSGHWVVIAHCNDHPHTINDNLYPVYKLRNEDDVTSLIKGEQPDIAYGVNSARKCN